MDAESFFSRWSRRKAQADPENEMTQQPAPARQSDVRPSEQADKDTASAAEQQPPPTLEDVAALTPASDYSRFVAPGVDDNIKRSALKKLFSDPHYNMMDGLDIYIEDYNKFEPISPHLLAGLKHAKALLDPLSQFEKPLSRLIDEMTEPAAATEQAVTTPGNGATIMASEAADAETAAATPAPPAVASADQPGGAPQANGPDYAKHPKDSP
jgi:hypothetical protein